VTPLGGTVVDGLCEILDEHLAGNRRGVPAAIGYVPWLDSKPLLHAKMLVSVIWVLNFF